MDNLYIIVILIFVAAFKKNVYFVVCFLMKLLETSESSFIFLLLRLLFTNYSYLQDETNKNSEILFHFHSVH